MPENHRDQALHTNEEIVNFLQHGDARGKRWLDSHPDARERALHELEILGDRDGEALHALQALVATEAKRPDDGHRQAS